MASKTLLDYLLEGGFGPIRGKVFVDPRWLTGKAVYRVRGISSLRTSGKEPIKMIEGDVLEPAGCESSYYKEFSACLSHEEYERSAQSQPRLTLLHTSEGVLGMGPSDDEAHYDVDNEHTEDR